MYLQELAHKIRSKVASSDIAPGKTDALFLIYAVLLRAKGCQVTESDIHDAWSAWMAGRNENHDSLVPFGELPKDIQSQDSTFAAAVRKVALEINSPNGSGRSFKEILFPTGQPATSENSRLLDLYKIMVQSSESLVSRRQGVNTFFLTINGALLTAYGVIVQTPGNPGLVAVGIFVLAFSGAILSMAWRSLIISFGQLNRGKFKVINAIEQYLDVAIYAAEWEALGRGEDPKIYRSFTSREIWVPNSLLLLHLLTMVISIFFINTSFHIFPYISESIRSLF